MGKKYINSKVAVIIYSGGIDSFTLLHKVLRSNCHVHPLSFNYGQRHSKELEYALKVCADLELDHKVVDISDISTLLQRNALTSAIPVPQNGYQSTEGAFTTVVPHRNMIFLSIALGYAASIEADTVFYGPHRDDASTYNDCTPEFISAMNHVVSVSDCQLKIEAPFLYYSKKDILKEGVSMGLDYKNTWSCYNGRAKACGCCGACIDRLNSFAAIHLSDPLDYEISI